MSQVLRVTILSTNAAQHHVRISVRHDVFALIRSSFTVRCSIRFSRIGRPHFPSAFKSMKFCMLRAPICSTSA